MRRFSGRKMAIIAAPLAVAIVAVPMATSAQALPLLGLLTGVLDINDLDEDLPFADAAGVDLLKLCVLEGVVVNVAADGDCDGDAVAGVQGPKGDPGTNGTNGTNGAPGATGAPGAAGADGEDGVSGYQMRTKSFSAAGGKISSFYLSCTGGRKVTGGGVYAASSAIVPLASRPSDTAKSWKVKVANTGRGAHSVKVYAICANV